MKRNLWRRIRLRRQTRKQTAISIAARAWDAEEDRRRRTKVTNNDHPVCDPRTIFTPENAWGFPGPL